MNVILNSIEYTKANMKNSIQGTTHILMHFKTEHAKQSRLISSKKNCSFSSANRTCTLHSWWWWSKERNTIWKRACIPVVCMYIFHRRLVDNLPLFDGFGYAYSILLLLLAPYFNKVEIRQRHKYRLTQWLSDWLAHFGLNEDMIFSFCSSCSLCSYYLLTVPRVISLYHDY